MTRARDHIVSKDITPYYQIISRCVRRAFLCGYDKATKRDYEYRRQWFVDRIRLLSSVFTIDVCAYAVMTDFCSSALESFFALLSLSMESCKTGIPYIPVHKARFTSKVLLTCMTYVDLNPIRAKIAQTPETSDYTSIKERITPQFDLNVAITDQHVQQQLNDFDLELKPRAQFDGCETIELQSSISFRLDDYLELVDWTGRIVRADKRRGIAEHLPPILKRFNIEADTWLTQATTFEATYNKDFRRRRSA